MLKSVMLASAMMISAPVLAQEVQDSATTAPVDQATAPTADQTPAYPAPSTETSQDQSAPATDAAAPTQADEIETAAEPQRASATQIAQIVETEFPTYDADKDGEITKEEFGKWMVALRSASDPATNAQSAEVQTWVGQAFASADTDKSTKVSKTELTSFLAQGAA